VVVVCHDSGRAKALRNLGARRRLLKRREWTLSFAGDADLARILAALRELGIPLLGGPAGWPPAEVCAELRAKGLIEGDFLEALHKGRGEYLVRAYPSEPPKPTSREPGP